VRLAVTHNGTVIEVVKGTNKDEIIRPASDRHDIAILEKLTDRDRSNCSIIIAAGLGLLGTMGAVQYLIDHWPDLQRSYGDSDFALALQFGPVDKSPLTDILANGSVIRRFPEK
jgi:hypothetical protein